MWAQLIKMSVKPGKEQDLPGLFAHMDAIEQPGSGLLRTMAMQDQNDPSQAYVLVVFDNEESARARERDPIRQEAMKPAQAIMADLFEGPPEFVDLTVMRDVVPQ